MDMQNAQLHPGHQNWKVLLATQRSTKEACNPKPSMLETLRAIRPLQFSCKLVEDSIFLETLYFNICLPIYNISFISLSLIIFKGFGLDVVWVKSLPRDLG